jgi:hypothetical protein
VLLQNMDKLLSSYTMLHLRRSHLFNITPSCTKLTEYWYGKNRKLSFHTGRQRVCACMHVPANKWTITNQGYIHQEVRRRPNLRSTS